MLSSNGSGQTPSSTPAPPSRENRLVKKRLLQKSSQMPVRLSLPLLKTANENYQVIVYLVEDKALAPETAKYQLKIFYCEKLWRDSFEGEDDRQVSLSIDGKLFTLSSMTSDISKNVSEFTVEPNNKRQTLTFDIPAEDLDLLSQAKSLFVIWSKINLEITPEGLKVLHNFVGGDNLSPTNKE